VLALLAAISLEILEQFLFLLEQPLLPIVELHLLLDKGLYSLIRLFDHRTDCFALLHHLLLNELDFFFLKFELFLKVLDLGSMEVAAFGVAASTVRRVSGRLLCSHSVLGVLHKL